MTNVEDESTLRTKRAERANDGTLWKPIDLLKELVKDIESGKISGVDQMLVIMRRPSENPKRPWRITHAQSGMDRSDHISLLELHKAMFMRDWIS